MATAEVASYALSGVVAVGVAWYALSSAVRTTRAETRAARGSVLTRRRVRAGASALLDAAGADAAFDADATVGVVNALVSVADAVWRGRTPQIKLPGARIVMTWATELHEQERRITRLAGRPKIGVLDVVNRRDDDEDRVSLRVTMRVRLQRAVFADPRVMRCDTRWTLMRGASGWEPVLIEAYTGDPAGLRRRFIARPSDDVERLGEEAMAELARDDQPVASELDDLLARDAPAYRALLELSVLDGRYAPAALEASLRHLLEVWEPATVGSPEPLRRVASRDAVDSLLHVGGRAGRGRVVVRGLELRQWRLTDLSRKQPPTVLVAITVRGVWYRISPDGSTLAGDHDRSHQFRLWWKLALADDAPTQWRLEHTSVPSDR